LCERDIGRALLTIERPDDTGAKVRHLVHHSTHGLPTARCHDFFAMVVYSFFDALEVNRILDVLFEQRAYETPH
jgi:hypothetical protein